MFLQTSKRRRNAKLIADFFICIHIPLFFICLYGYTQAPTVYAPGFEYAESNPRTSGAESPYDVMTLEWATAHPTTYMDGVFYEDWEEWIRNGDDSRRSVFISCSTNGQTK